MSDLSPAPLIKLHDITKIFGGIPAVRNLSLEIPAGNVYGFLGAMGSGKTTTLRMIAGLMSPTSGTGFCLGYDIVKEAKKLRYKLGYVTQHFSLYSDLTVYENLKLIANLYLVDNPRHIIDQSIHIFSLEKYRNHLASQLSGGWKRRLSLAASLIHTPKLLILDEPTAGVDPISRIEFWDRIYEYALDKTVIVSTHYMDEAERCAEICYLETGSLKFFGKPQQLIKQLKLCTYLIWNTDLKAAQQSLSTLPFTRQVMRFGNTLHWCIEETEVEQARQHLSAHHYEDWQLIPTTLEEAFIILRKTETHVF